MFVVGATGATGRLVVDELRNKGGADVVSGVRSADKAQKLGIDKGGVALSPGFDVTAPGSALAGALGGVDAVIICTGFVPGNPFKMSEAAHAVDNEGVIHVVDACKQAGVKKVVLISSILTNGRGWGAQDSPGFKITNAFGKGGGVRVEQHRVDPPRVLKESACVSFKPRESTVLSSTLVSNVNLDVSNLPYTSATSSMRSWLGRSICRRAG